MAKNVDFKKVAEQLRYGILGGFQMMVPDEFEKLSEQEKIAFYERVFELHHDCCKFLTSYLYIDELNKNYYINDIKQ